MSGLIAFLYKQLERPFVYSLSQKILGPGAETNITLRIKRIIDSLPQTPSHLDIGCGPASWLFRVGIKPAGIDINPDYIAAYKEQGADGYIGSAADLPFPDNSYNFVWTIGLLHHLPNNVAQSTIAEALRVCAPGGQFFLLDAVKPDRWISSPLAALIRRLDRGQYMRTQSELCKLLPDPQLWTIERFRYAYTGLEMLLCVYKKEAKI